MLLLLGSCMGDSMTGSGEEQDPLPSPIVPADGRLEAVTWNIEWFGSYSRGPSNELQQLENVARVMDSLRADLYAFQEIYSQEVLDDLLGRLSGYRGFVAPHVDWQQKMAFVYNTQAIDSVSSGAVMQGQSEYDWAGRLPLFFSFRYRYADHNIPVYAVVIHAKANTGDDADKKEAYERRVRAADSLFAYLQDQHPDARVLLLGDYNDDVDESIYNGQPTPYDEFTASTDYRVITGSLSQQGRSSYLPGGGTDLIDHIAASNELIDYYNTSSEQIFFDALDFIPDFESTTSDHLPVWATFDMRATKAL